MIKKAAEKKKTPTNSAKQAAQQPRETSGPIFCLFSLLAISLLAGVNFGSTSKVYLAGEIASQNIAAHQDLLIEDRESTERKRELLAEMQPPVYDLSQEPFMKVRREALEILREVRGLSSQMFNQKRWEVSEKLNSEISLQSVEIWTKDEFRDLFINGILPRLEALYEKGIVQDRQFLRNYEYGIQVRDLSSGEETLYTNFTTFYDLNSVQDVLDGYMREELNLKLRSRKAALDLLMPLLRPNMILNQEATQKRVAEIKSAVDPVFYHIKKGEIVVRQGERVTEDQQRKLQVLMSDPPDSFSFLKTMGTLLMVLAVFLGLYYASQKMLENMALKNRDFYLLSAVLLSFAFLSKFLDISGDGLAESLLNMDPGILYYSLPVAGAVGLLSLFFPKGPCILAGFLLSYICTTMIGGGLELFLFFFLTGFLNIYLLTGTINRTQVLRTVFPLAAGSLLFWAGIALYDAYSGVHFLSGSGFVLAGSALSLFVLLAFSPIAEHSFGYASRFRLMELMNLEQPLLQDLMVTAPGTYHHSLIVSNLVEAGARAINARALLVKVAALYHDIGKLKNPEYFIENQFGGKNKHDRLSPSMSALILTSHVKKGVEMARENKLGPELTDLIQQHHGTSLISFFYNKAKESKSKGDSEIREEDFRYSGPKPQTKEAGLILLADAIEASSRTLVDPSPSRIKGHIKNIISKIYSEGQLDESELTLKDLNRLTDVFHRILTGIFHQRVEYPKVGGMDDEKSREHSAP